MEGESVLFVSSSIKLIEFANSCYLQACMLACYSLGWQGIKETLYNILLLTSYHNAITCPSL